RRAAFLAHADPISVLSAVVLARDGGLVESFLGLSQARLMTLFRSGATHLPGGAPRFLGGLAAAPPPRDTPPAASRVPSPAAAGWPGSIATTGRPRISSHCATRSVPSTCMCSQAPRARSRP